jgi:hypothetical protein
MLPVKKKRVDAVFAALFYLFNQSPYLAQPAMKAIGWARMDNTSCGSVDVAKTNHAS